MKGRTLSGLKFILSDEIQTDRNSLREENTKRLAHIGKPAEAL